MAQEKESPFLYRYNVKDFKPKNLDGELFKSLDKKRKLLDPQDEIDKITANEGFYKSDALDEIFDIFNMEKVCKFICLYLKCQSKNCARRKLKYQLKRNALATYINIWCETCDFSYFLSNSTKQVYEFVDQPKDEQNIESDDDS